MPEPKFKVGQRVYVKKGDGEAKISRVVPSGEGDITPVVDFDRYFLEGRHSVYFREDELAEASSTEPAPRYAKGDEVCFDGGTKIRIIEDTRPPLQEENESTYRIQGESGWYLESVLHLARKPDPTNRSHKETFHDTKSIVDTVKENKTGMHMLEIPPDELPKPLSDLVKQWRDKAGSCSKTSLLFEDEGEEYDEFCTALGSFACTYRNCADALEAYYKPSEATPGLHRAVETLTSLTRGETG